MSSRVILMQSVSNLVSNSLLASAFFVVLVLKLIDLVSGKKKYVLHALELFAWMVVILTLVKVVLLGIDYRENPDGQLFLDRLAGPYRMSVRFQLLFVYGLPLIFAMKSIRRSFLAGLIVTFLISLGYGFEKYVILVTSLHRDYGVSANMLEDIIKGLAFYFSQGLFIAFLLILAVILYKKLRIRSSQLI